MPNDTWRTPSWLIDNIQQWRVISIDPCASPNPRDWFAQKNYTEDQDGLTKSWHVRVGSKKRIVYWNPPYSSGNLIKWVRKARFEYEKNKTESIGLVPIDMSTEWWEVANTDIGEHSVPFCAIRKRLKFEGAKDTARFSSALIYYGDYRLSFCSWFGAIGRVYARKEYR
jgi:phage N-6-adenine-methyltransferase